MIATDRQAALHRPVRIATLEEVPASRPARGVLTVEECDGLSARELAALRAEGFMAPMAGGRGRHSRAVAGAAVAVTGGGIVAEVGGNTAPFRLQEIGVFFESGVAPVVGIGRPGNTPTTGTAQVLQVEDPADGAPTTNVYTAGWGTAPTVPAAFLRRISLPATVGQGVIFTWPIGKELILGASNRAQGVLVWIISLPSATSTVCGIYVAGEE